MWKNIKIFPNSKPPTMEEFIDLVMKIAENYDNIQKLKEILLKKKPREGVSIIQSPPPRKFLEEIEGIKALPVLKPLVVSSSSVTIPRMMNLAISSVNSVKAVSSGDVFGNPAAQEKRDEEDDYFSLNTTMWTAVGIAVVFLLLQKERTPI